MTTVVVAVVAGVTVLFLAYSLWIESRRTSREVAYVWSVLPHSYTEEFESPKDQAAIRAYVSEGGVLSTDATTVWLVDRRTGNEVFVLKIDNLYGVDVTWNGEQLVTIDTAGVVDATEFTAFDGIKVVVR